MERYVLVCNVEGDALKLHEKITNEACRKFNKKRQKLPAHFTIKAPFETDQIDDMVNVLEKFSHNKIRTSIKIQGFGKFRQDVVYMNVEVSDEAKQVHDELIDEIAQIPWIEFKKNEGKDRVFHCTILSRRIQDKFNEIWEYVNQHECEFDLYFDNLSLYIWRNNTWVIYKKFKFNEP